MAQSRGIDVVFCGHTHAPHYANEYGAQYFNTGCWIHDRLTYAAVDERGPRVGEFIAPDPQPDSQDEFLDETPAEPEPWVPAS
jgi:hypothetical protein